MSDPNSAAPTPDQIALTAARLAAIVESSEEAIVSKKLDGTILTWNAAAERIFGYSAAEMVGASIFTLIPPDLHEDERRILARIARGEQIAHTQTIRRRKDGTLIPIELSITPVRNASGEIVGASSIKRDTSERRLGQQTAARLAAIVESSDDAIISKALDGTVLTWNAGAERMYGYSAAEIVGRSIYSLVPERLQQEEERILRQVSRGEPVRHYETVRCRKDGKEIDISLALSPIRDATGTITGASSIQRDISERKRAEEALRQAAKMEAIGVLAGGLAHDFNNQLYAVSGFAHFIGRDPGLSPAARQDLLELQKVADRMASLTRQLLAFARQQVLAPETLDLNAAVEDTMPMLQRLIGNTRIQLELAPGPKWVRVDRAQLVQVLLNLIINARDAMEDGGTIVLRTVTLEVSPGHVLDRLGMPVDPGAYAALSVTDTGMGIPAEHMPHIFEPFYTTKEVGVGTGLGLATVEGVVAQSGGRIQVDSKVNRGTTITVLLPLTSEPVVQPRSGGYRLKQNSRSLGRVLVVEDEDAVRAVVMRTLQAEGYEVLGAREGGEALRELEEVGGAVNAVLTDLVMPGMGGRQLAAELSRKYRQIPIIWMSGHARESEQQRGELSRDEPFLQKPVLADVLLETVAQVIEKHSTVRS
jgi:PAS domain S-box-containing protein